MNARRIDERRTTGGHPGERHRAGAGARARPGRARPGSPGTRQASVVRARQASVERTRVAVVALALGTAIGGCRIEATPPARGDPAREAAVFHAEVTAILIESARAWNAGDLDGFMRHYEQAPTTTYIGAAGLIEGWDAIRTRYEPAFAPGAERDSLRFESLRTRPLGQGFGLATARYVLERDGETTASGPFTLVLRRIEGAWKIIHDQSASDPPPGTGGSQ